MRTDEEVKAILIREKKRRDTIISVLAFFIVICIIVAICFTVLYFKSNDSDKKDEIIIYTDGGTIRNSNIHTNYSATNGDVTISSNAPIVGGIVVAGTCVLGGFLCLLYFVRK